MSAGLHVQASDCGDAARNHQSTSSAGHLAAEGWGCYMACCRRGHRHNEQQRVESGNNKEGKKKKRRIIVFFLINPERRIISTREVRMQTLSLDGCRSEGLF